MHQSVTSVKKMPHQRRPKQTPITSFKPKRDGDWQSAMKRGPSLSGTEAITICFVQR